MRISVVIPAYNNPHALTLSLETLASQTLKPHEVIIVDDGSSPPITRNATWVKVHRLRSEGPHRGSSAAKNFGASKAKGDYLCFCDSDILHLPDALESLAACMHQWESEGVKGVLLNTMRVGLPDGYKDKYLTDLNRLMTVCRTAGLLNDEPMDTAAQCYEQNESLISRDFFKALGGYDEAGFPSWGMNNQDLDLRVVLAGGRISSAIPRIGTGTRLYCFHQFHENHCDKQQAASEFSAKWGEPWSDVFFRKVQGMVASGEILERGPTPQEAQCQRS